MSSISFVFPFQFLHRSLKAAVALCIAVGLAVSPMTAQAVSISAGHYVASDYSGIGTWDNRNVVFNDATPVAIGGNFNNLPAAGPNINGHGTVFFNANNDSNLNSGAAFRVAGSASVSSGGLNPTSGARGITFTSVFQTNVAGRGGAFWHYSGLIGNEQPGGGRGDWSLSYTSNRGAAFQSNTQILTTSTTFNDNTPHILSYSIAASNGATQLWYDGVLQATGTADFIAANGTNTLDTNTASNFSIGVSTGANLGSNVDNGFIHGNMAEARIDSFSAPSAGPSASLTNAEVVVLHNHLAGKYGIGLLGNEFYSGDNVVNGNYDNGVTGIVAINGTKVSSTDDRWLTSLTSSGLTITELSNSLSDNEGVFAGHNEFIDTSVPNATLVGNRASRVWFVEETGSVDFSLTFDMSDLGLAFTNPSLLFASTNALNFVDTGIVATVVGDRFTYDLTNFTGGNGYFTIAQAAIPEPASLSLLALAGIALLRHRQAA